MGKRPSFAPGALERRRNARTMRWVWEWPAACPQVKQKRQTAGQGIRETKMLYRRVMGMALAGSAGAALLMAGALAQNQPASTDSLNPGPADPALRVVTLP